MFFRAKYLFIIGIILYNSLEANSLASKQVKLQSGWVVKNSYLNFNVDKVNIPNSIHTVLHNAKLIDDPLYRYNDLELRNLTKNDNWVFHNSFTLTQDDLNSAQKISLVFDSIDTVSAVYLNDIQILSTNNQFLQYQVDNIKPLLKSNNNPNILEIRFESPTKVARQLATSYSYRVPPECPPKVQKGECHVNFLRKEQCSFSWDWGPAFANIGINGDVYLSLINLFDFDFGVSVYPVNKNNLNTWNLDHLINIKLGSASLQTATIRARIEELNFEKVQQISLNQPESELRVNLELSNSNVKLWWPNGYGEQKMYKLDVTLEMNGERLVREKMIGFRSVELVQEKTPSNKEEHGLTFYFKINNVDIFLKGSNWIPADSFQEKISPEYLRWLMKSARDANMNVLRIWGGGIYEPEEFYRVANEYGIMIWEDFMYACATHPTNREFLENVEKEIKYQVNRLKHHPCIIIWAGNNENEAAVSTNWYDTDKNKQLYADDYRALYIGTIKPIVEKYDPPMSRPYLSSSPTNGLGSEKENWLAKNPYDWNYGDLHFYDYQMNSWYPESFPLPRLMSEFGVQSLPSPSTLSKSYINPEDMDLESELNEHRQHHVNGNQEIIYEINNNLRMPDFGEQDKKRNFVSQIYLSQLNQAMHLKVGNELYRRARNHFDYNTGHGLCMGTMYWQFNDLWEAPTWATIEYGGKWKLGHYFVKNSYNHLHLSPVFNKTSIDIYAISDYTQTIDSKFSLKIYSYDNFNPVFEKSYVFKIEPLMAKSIVKLDLNEIKSCTVNATKSCVLILSSDDDKFDNKENINFLLFNNKLAHVSNLKTPTLMVKEVKKLDNNGLFSITLQSDQVALFVWLDMNTRNFNGIFSDNGFHMVTREKTVKYQADRSSLSELDIKNNLNVHSLMNSYKSSANKVFFSFHITIFFLFIFYFFKN